MQNINKYLQKNSFKLLVVLFLGMCVLIFSRLPYINTYEYPLLYFIPIYLLAVILFKISKRINVLVGILAIVLALPWLIVGGRVRVEELGILAFVLLITATIQEIMELRRKNA